MDNFDFCLNMFEVRWGFGFETMFVLRDYIGIISGLLVECFFFCVESLLPHENRWKKLLEIAVVPLQRPNRLSAAFVKLPSQGTLIETKQKSPRIVTLEDSIDLLYEVLLGGRDLGLLPLEAYHLRIPSSRGV